ncbi:translation initiation factor IF-2 [Ascochyta rabiei]|uniref:Translation initiation factor IF-2, mitochondrial n=1 Tax=Didymella rabiei TaxID=5454 RepID=A0A163K223_DIDRA|nr:translation initiation factor IF-2 [Ascochyta rabiei]KZM26728.1 GTPase [Ascochyta rabiei]UPX19250.1 translation initiation factor IF-2 [Ascochyta rabiei]
MRRAQGFRVSSTRDICIFCATRQIATANAPLPASSAQRRYLNTSSRVHQAEAQLYKSDDAPPRPLTQAEQMRQALAAAQPAPSQSPPGGHTTPAQRMRESLGTQEPAWTQSPMQRQPPQDRRTPNRGGLFDGFGRDQNRDRSAPTARRLGSDSRFDSRPPQRDRFRVNMDSKPQFDTPAFGPGHLRRRNEPQATPAQSSREELRRPPPRAVSSRGKLDQTELDELLGNEFSQSRPPRPYQPLARNPNAQRKCFNCGSPDHLSAACPNKPTFRERPDAQRYTTGGKVMYQPPQFNRETSYQPQQAALDSLADAANEWVSKRGSKLEVEPRSYTVEEPRDNKARTIDRERRRSRFELDEEPMEVRNRYEQPQRRKASGRNNRRVSRFDEEDEVEDRVVDLKEQKRLRKEAKKAAQLEKAEPTPITLPEYISVANLAGMLRLRVEDFVTKLEELGFEDVQSTQVLNAEHAGLIAQEYNFEPSFIGAQEDGDLYAAPELTPEEYAELPARPPVVTIMGHVDHGKTTILDYMRSTSVAAGEFGGITQHIGAFSVPLANGKKITFLDTPGHSAFETMRARGANVTDIVILVVAADDSVMPQTVEAIKHAQAAKVPIIVAINKMDKQQADPDAVKLDLGRHGIEVEDFGGDVQAIPVSGKTGQGIPDLEEAISTLSELLDHRADPQANVEGTVLEGTTKKSGRVATVLVRSGTLRQGTALVAGTTWTRVRTLRNEAGVVVEEAGPGIAVEVDGWREQPIAGDEVLQAIDEQEASSVSELRIEKVERQQMARDMEAINIARREEAERREAEEAAKRAAEEGDAVVEEAEVKDKGPAVVSFIVKGDVSGSVEAVIDSVSALGNAEVSARILRYGVGPPSEFDIQHAADAEGHIINFNTTIPAHVAKLAEEKGVTIFDSNIIYRTVETIKDLLSEKLAPSIIQKVTGEVEIAAIFEISLGGKKKMKVAGSRVRNGVVERGNKARVLRGDTVVHDGIIENIRNQKKDVESMRKDTECGISFAAWDDFKIGDKIQCYEETQHKRTL